MFLNEKNKLRKDCPGFIRKIKNVFRKDQIGKKVSAVLIIVNMKLQLHSTYPGSGTIIIPAP